MIIIVDCNSDQEHKITLLIGKQDHTYTRSST